MYNTTLAQKKSGKLNPYLVKEIMESTPQQLLIKLYDFTIASCQRHNLEKTNAGLQELINSLKFEPKEVKEVAFGFLKLYRFCQEEMRKQNYTIVYKILTELRDEWKKAFKM